MTPDILQLIAAPVQSTNTMDHSHFRGGRRIETLLVDTEGKMRNGVPIVV